MAVIRRLKTFNNLQLILKNDNIYTTGITGSFNFLDIYSSNGTFLRNLNPVGGNITSPVGVAITESGILYIGDNQNQQISIFNISNDFEIFISTFGDSSTQTQFMGIDSITYDEVNKRVYVYDTINTQKIRAFSLNGTYIFGFSTNSIIAYAVSTDGNVYILFQDSLASHITIYNSIGIAKLQIENLPLTTFQIAVNSIGIVYYLDLNTPGKILSTATTTSVFSAITPSTSSSEHAYNSTHSTSGIRSSSTPSSPKSLAIINHPFLFLQLLLLVLLYKLVKLQ